MNELAAPTPGTVMKETLVWLFHVQFWTMYSVDVIGPYVISYVGQNRARCKQASGAKCGANHTCKRPGRPKSAPMRVTFCPPVVDKAEDATSSSRKSSKANSYQSTNSQVTPVGRTTEDTVGRAYEVEGWTFTCPPTTTLQTRFVPPPVEMRKLQ